MLYPASRDGCQGQSARIGTLPSLLAWKWLTECTEDCGNVTAADDEPDGRITDVDVRTERCDSGDNQVVIRLHSKPALVERLTFCMDDEESISY